MAETYTGAEVWPGCLRGSPVATPEGGGGGALVGGPLAAPPSLLCPPTLFWPTLLLTSVYNIPVHAIKDDLLSKTTHVL